LSPPPRRSSRRPRRRARQPAYGLTAIALQGS
jgi:hypothetical protein